MRLGDTANDDAAAVRQAARRRARARGRADAGAALRDPAARPARRRRGEGRAPGPRRVGPRAPRPAMIDPDGRTVGATFLRNNLDKRSIGLDLQAAERAASSSSPSRPASTCRRELQARHDGPDGPRLRRRRRGAPRARSTCRSRASATPARRRTATWPAYASIVEAMSGIYEYRNGPDRPAGRHPGRRARRHQLGPVRASSACSPRCATATARARASTSTSRCSTRWSR